MPYWVYILKSLKDGKLYTGSTGDLRERIERHNQGRERYTKNRGPFELVYYEEFDTRAKAVRREKYLKTAQGGAEKRELIIKFSNDRLKEFVSL